MGRLKTIRKIPTLVALIIGAVLGGAIYAQAGGPITELMACTDSGTTVPTKLGPGLTCGIGEDTWTWNTAGPTGATGSAGPIGPAGPAGSAAEMYGEYDSNQALMNGRRGVVRVGYTSTPAGHWVVTARGLIVNAWRTPADARVHCVIVNNRNLDGRGRAQLQVDAGHASSLESTALFSVNRTGSFYYLCQNYGQRPVIVTDVAVTATRYTPSR